MRGARTCTHDTSTSTCTTCKASRCMPLWTRYRPRQAGVKPRSVETPSRALESQGYHDKRGASPHKSRGKTDRSSWLYMKVTQTISFSFSFSFLHSLPTVSYLHVISTPVFYLERSQRGRLLVGEVVFAMAVRSVCGHCVCYDEMTECHGVEVASVSRLCLG